MGHECINIKLVLIVFFMINNQFNMYQNNSIKSIYLNNELFKMRTNTLQFEFKMYLLSLIF